MDNGIDNEFDLESYRLAYAHVEEVDKDIYIGGIFVCDGNLRPLEFRVTNSIRPNTIQYLLYGAELIPFIYQNLVLINCLGNLKENPEIVLCSSEIFLGARKKIDHCLMAVHRHGDIVVSDDYQTGKTKSIESHRFVPITIRTAPGFESDAEKTFLLEKIFTSRDLSEPFERLKNAIKEYYQRKGTK